MLRGHRLADAARYRLVAASSVWVLVERAGQSLPPIFRCKDLVKRRLMGKSRKVLLLGYVHVIDDESLPVAAVNYARLGHCIDSA